MESVDQKIARPWPSRWFFLIAGLLTAYALLGVPLVPFHPDESTAFYMSGDFETFWSNPLALAWIPGQPIDAKANLRMLDAQLSRHVVGLGRFLAGRPAPAVDWDWTQSWEWNRAAGALPDPRLLLAGRLAVTLLLPFSLLFTYLTGRQMTGEAAGLLAALLLGLNALALLHARRAMAEGPLLLGVCFALWTITQSGKRPWLGGFGLALAFNAKQSAIGLFPAALLACLLNLDQKNRTGWRQKTPLQRHFRFDLIKKIVIAWLQMFIVFALLTVLFNPFLWRAPVAAGRIALARRQTLLTNQVQDSLRLAPGKVTESIGGRLAVLVVNLFLAPPSFAEYGNYRAETAAAEQAYLAIPGSNLLRGIAGGGMLLGLCLLGMALSLLDSRHIDHTRQRTILLVWLAMICQGAVMVFFIPLSWQRYVVPLLPFACLWPAYGVARFTGIIGNHWRASALKLRQRAGVKADVRTQPPSNQPEI